MPTETEVLNFSITPQETKYLENIAQLMDSIQRAIGIPRKYLLVEDPPFRRESNVWEDLWF